MNISNQISLPHENLSNIIYWAHFFFTLAPFSLRLTLPQSLSVPMVWLLKVPQRPKYCKVWSPGYGSLVRGWASLQEVVTLRRWDLLGGRSLVTIGFWRAYWVPWVSSLPDNNGCHAVLLWCVVSLWASNMLSGCGAKHPPHGNYWLSWECACSDEKWIDTTILVCWCGLGAPPFFSPLPPPLYCGHMY